MQVLFSKWRTTEHVRGFLLKYRRHIPAAALLLGFFWDLATLGRPDRIFENAVIIAYLAIAGGTILLLNVRQRRETIAKSLPLVALMQFSFGNLASALLVLYGHSGTFEGSLLFFLVLGGFFIGNEFLRGRYEMMRAHIGAFYLLLFAYFALVIPVALGEIGTRVFLLSGLASLAAIAAFIGILFLLGRKDVVKNLFQLSLVVAAIYGSFNALYFLNILPPVPLALRDIGIYHSILRQSGESGGNYLAEYEDAPWYEPFSSTAGTFHAPPGARASCFSSVFAPAGLTAPVFHRWERKDAAGEWQTLSLISFPIIGGRDNGYRGYSVKTALAPGAWRCSVETERRALIGRETFTVVSASTTPPSLIQRTL